MPVKIKRTEEELKEDQRLRRNFDSRVRYAHKVNMGGEHERDDGFCGACVDRWKEIVGQYYDQQQS